MSIQPVDFHRKLARPPVQPELDTHDHQPSPQGQGPSDSPPAIDSHSAARGMSHMRALASEATPHPAKAQRHHLPASQSSNVSIDPSTGHTTHTFDESIKGTAGKGLNWSINGKINISNRTTAEDGSVSYTATTEGTVSVSAGIDLKHGGVSGSVSNGFRLSYNVRLPAEAAAQGVTVNPFDPSTMPVGSSVTINSADVEGSAFEASFRNLFLNSSGTSYEGNSVKIEAVGDNVVQVTAGPTSGINTLTKFGVKFDSDFQASFQSGLKIDEGQYQTATFDLNTPEGRQAYDHFLVTGEMPKANGTGISDVAQIYTGSHAHSSGASGTLGNVTIGSSSTNSAGNVTKIEYPDGRVETISTSTSYVPHESTTTVTQTFHPQQDYPGGPTRLEEDMSSRTYTTSFTIPEGSEGQAMASNLNIAATGEPHPEPPVFQPGQHVTLKMSYEELKDFKESAASLSHTDPQGNVSYEKPDLVLVTSPGRPDRPANPHEFFYQLYEGNIYSSVNHMAGIATQTDWRLENYEITQPS